MGRDTRTGSGAVEGGQVNIELDDLVRQKRDRFRVSAHAAIRACGYGHGFFATPGFERPLVRPGSTTKETSSMLAAGSSRSAAGQNQLGRNSIVRLEQNQSVLSALSQERTSLTC